LVRNPRVLKYWLLSRRGLLTSGMWLSHTPYGNGA